jgi:hypothetical protein
MPFEKRLGAFAGKDADEERVGVRKRHHKQRDGSRPAFESDLGLAEVDLGLARSMLQRDEDLSVFSPVVGNRLLDDGQPALISVFVAKPLEDPLGGMATLARGRETTVPTSPQLAVTAILGPRRSMSQAFNLHRRRSARPPRWC